MNLLWPWSLSLLLLIPLLVALYLWSLRRKRRFAVHFSSIALIREAMPRHMRWRRHLPFALLIAGAVALLLALARPVMAVTIPMNQATVILAIDVSRSMCATDVDPNRLTVAQQAALAFIEDQPAGTQIGIVAFTGIAEIVVPPTNDKVALRNAVNNFTTAIGTAIGSAILKSIDAIAEVNDAVAPSGVNLRAGDEEIGPMLEDVDGEDAAALYQPDIIVLLTDGANSRGPYPVDAAQQAADRRLRVYTIGFGTMDPGAMICAREQMGGDIFQGRRAFSGGFDSGGGYPRYLLLDEPTLRSVADSTGGAYFEAENAEQLLQIFLDLPSYIILQTETREISVFFSMLGALMAATGVALSLVWNRFP